MHLNTFGLKLGMSPQWFLNSIVLEHDIVPGTA